MSRAGTFGSARVAFAALLVALAGCAAAPDEGDGASSGVPPHSVASSSSSPAVTISRSPTPAQPGGPPATVPPRSQTCSGEPAPEEGDWVAERVNITIEASTSFLVRVSLWVSPPADVGRWSQVLKPSGAVVITQTEPAEDSGSIDVRGSGTVWLSGCLEHGSNSCCAEEYLAGHWSMDPDSPREDYPYRLVTGGPVGLAVGYSARSSFCGASMQGNGTVSSRGIGTLPVDAAFVCS